MALPLRKAGEGRGGRDWGGGRRLAGGIDPHGGAVQPQLPLPDGDAALYFLDDVAARLESLRAVRGRDDDRDARLPRRDHADPMTHAGACLGPPLPHLGENATELSVHHLVVCRVLDRGHAVLLRPVAYSAQERARAAAFGRGHFAEKRVEGERAAREKAHPRCLKNAECGVRNAECIAPPSNPVARVLDRTMSFNSAFRIPHSAFVLSSFRTPHSAF